jgi:MIP family channel proteins
MHHNLWQALLAEFVGTFALVFLGCVAVILAMQAGGLSASLIFGLALIICIYSWGIYSGGHFNPAISFGVAISGREGFNWIKMFLYWIVQLLGGILAAAIIVYFFGSASGVGASIGSFTKTNMLKAVLLEALLTMFLVVTFLFVTSKPLHSMIAGFVVGAALVAGMYVGLPYTGGSLNPARSLGPALFGNQMGTYWIYAVGPLLGALVAALVYRGFTSIGHCVKPPMVDTQVLSDKTVRIVSEGVSKFTNEVRGLPPMRT